MGWYQRRVHGEAHPTSTTTQLKVNNFTQHNSQHVSLLLLQLQLLRLLRLLLLLFLRPLNAPLEACSDCDVIQQHLRQIGSVSTLEHTAAAKAQVTVDGAGFSSSGILTVVVAGLGALFLLSFPDKAGSRSLRFLTDDEQKCIIMRVNADRGDADLTKFEWKRWAASGKDWKIWAYASIFGSITTVSYALAYFLPIILNLGLGFDTGTSQCLIAPPYAFAGIMMVATGWWGDRYR